MATDVWEPAALDEFGLAHLTFGRAGPIEIYISPANLDEVAGVLARKFGWSRRVSEKRRRTDR